MFDSYYIKHKKYIEQIKEDIDDAEKVLSTSGDINLKSFDLHDKLNDKVWDKKSNLRPGIREQLIQIAHDFYDTLDIAEITETDDPDQKPDTTFDKYIKDVLFVGSLASFNYSSYADVDLHLLMDENLLVGNNKLALNILKKYFTECKNDWNLKHTDLTVEGYDCELYVQDVNEVNASNGVYSLMKNKWLKQPQKLDVKNFDRAWVEKKALDYIEQIDSLEEVINSNPDLEVVEKAKDELKKIKDKIVQGRKDSLAAGQGEMNSYNILFKILRRSGHIGKINELTVTAYDMLNSFENNFKKESNNMKFDRITEAEVDAIADFERLYGPKATKALKAYLSKRTKKSAEEVLASDDEFEKFGNWAYKHLGIDVYERFTKYDVGTFGKRTSSLSKDQDSVDRRNIPDDRHFEVVPPGRGFGKDFWKNLLDKDPSLKNALGSADEYDSKFRAQDEYNESIIVKEDGESRLEDVIDILNTKWEDPLDIGVEEEPYKYRFIISTEVDKVANFLNKALDEYEITKNKKEFIDKVFYMARMYCSIEVPDGVVNEYANKLMALVDVKGESIVEDEKENGAEKEETTYKPLVILGAVSEESTIIIVVNKPNNDINQILTMFGGEKWTKDSEYSYWYFTAQKKLDVVKSELEKKFGNKIKIEIEEKESKVKENTEEQQQVEQQSTSTNEPQPEQKPEEQNQKVDNNAEEAQQEQPKTESESAPKITGASWEEFLKNVEEQSIYKVDSAFKRHPNQWIELIDDTGKIYDGEVISYSDGGFELLYANIHPVPNAEESKKQTPINESYADDAIENIKDVLKKYFEVDPETEEENPQYDEDFTAQEAIDEIVGIIY